MTEDNIEQPELMPPDPLFDCISKSPGGNSDIQKIEECIKSTSNYMKKGELSTEEIIIICCYADGKVGQILLGAKMLLLRDMVAEAYQKYLSLTKSDKITGTVASIVKRALRQ